MGRFIAIFISCAVLGLVACQTNGPTAEPRQTTCWKGDFNWGLTAKGGGINVCGFRRFAPKPVQKVDIAVIDTGVDATHPMLQKRIKKDFNGFDGYGHSTNLYELNTNDINGHGTHIAGIIQAVGQASGVNPLVIMPIKFIPDSGFSGATGVAVGIRYAIKHGVRVINISAGGLGAEDNERAAFLEARRADCLIVVAAGNDARKLGFEYPDGYHYFPAEYGFDNIIVVGAETADGGVAEFSNFGPKVDILAPGENIYSSFPKSSYAVGSGTSQATAFVSAVAGLILSRYPTMSARDVKKLILESGRHSPAFSGKTKSGIALDGEAVANKLREISVARSSEKPSRNPAQAAKP